MFLKLDACLVSVGLLCSILSCSKASELTSKVKMDSAHTIGLDAKIEVGKIKTSQSDLSGVEDEIREQLYYAIGQLNGYNSGADMAQVAIADIQLESDASGNVTGATYKATMRVAWAREYQIPRSFDFILPEGGDSSSINDFFNAYDHKCIDSGAHDYNASIFWYYYRPQNCELNQSGSAPYMVRVNAKFQLSAMNTHGKSPEYHKVWEDKKLVATAIFGKADSGATSEWDAGISAYNSFYQDLISRFGTPSYSSVILPVGANPGLKNPSVNLVWDYGGHSVDVSLHVVEGIRQVNSEFIAMYNERTKNSDLVTYSGHSGLGANIRALARMGSFVRDQYQIYLVNGCDTFAYTDKALENAHAAVNPGFAGTKYFDMITNAMPSYFHANSRSNMALINALFGQNKTYREILADFDQAQRAVVTGEEDNNYPLPFN